MTSDGPKDRAYVWTWLPGEVEPVVAGVLETIPAPRGGHVVTFAYGQSYLSRPDALTLYLPELPKKRGRQEPGPGLEVHGVIRDAGPDAWGQRVIMRRLLERDVRGRDSAEVPLLAYLLESGSNRPGALDFQHAPDRYIARSTAAPVRDLLQAADKLQAGDAIDPELADALFAGSSVGGARPKASIVDGDRHLIAKFSALADTYPVMKAEAVAMDLARCVGLDVAPTELIEVEGRDVLLVERFDRAPGGLRRQFVSALTILGLHELTGRHATYHDLADVIRSRFVHRSDTLRQLFGRIVLNILTGNNDDHARNHAAFWDGERLALTPAYDIGPQPRTGQEQAQAMAIATNGARLAQVATCLDAAATYELTTVQAREIVDHQLTVIHDEWHAAADRARLTATERDALWERQVLNPFATYGYPR